ncbi:hypothetical protein, partial [Prevotellamassilia timonensis]|uniref:hypothetical protein n=1 Tax=Prevotellamassilia timonensis TaxID=1852370 RepID=UPI003079783C
LRRLTAANLERRVSRRGNYNAHTLLNKGSQTVLITLKSVSLCHKNPDAGRVAPISGSVWCLRFVLAFCALSPPDFVNASPYQMT